MSIFEKPTKYYNPEIEIPTYGEEIYVWSHRHDDEEKNRRVFLGMFDGFFMCKSMQNNKYPPAPWRYAKPIQEERREEGSEILPEPFTPKKGDEIMVWNDGPDKCRRIFLDMCEGYFACRAVYEGNPITWTNAEPIPKKSPWIQNDGKAWPDCKPSDVVRIKLFSGDVSVVDADNVNWSYKTNKPALYSVKEWKLNK